MAANVAVAQTPAGNLKPAKDKSTERIDGIVATIMAIGRAAVQSWCLRFGNSNDAFVGRFW
jgi:phage terminase large subunit-like protein